MKSLNALSDSELLNQLKALVQEERRVGANILEHLREVESRRLHASLGYSSLFTYCTEALGYSESAAQRRISAMRFMREVPKVKEAVESGRVSLSNIAQVQTFLRQERKGSRVVYSTAQKLELLEKVSGLSSRECEKQLASLSPVAALPRDKERVITGTHTEIRFTADVALMKKLEQVKGLLAHRNFSPTYSELFSMLADLAIKQLDLRERKGRVARQDDGSETEGAKLSFSSKPYLDQAHSALPAPEVKIENSGHRVSSESAGAQVPPQVAPPSPPTSRYIAAGIRREIWRRDNGTCTFKSTKTGRLCGSRHALEIEHLLPFALGGTHELENLTLRCRAHNQLSAVRTYGENKVSPPLRSRNT